MRLAVFCGASPGRADRYVEVAAELGILLAERGIGLVYGGSDVGTMRALANAALAAGGEVTGVIPRILVDREVAHRGLTTLHEVDDVHCRKALMAELSDGFAVLPGGLGTLDELFDAWSWRQLGLHRKPIGLVDVGGYYQPLFTFLRSAVDEGFIRKEIVDMIVVEPDPSALVDRLVAEVAGATGTAAVTPLPADGGTGRRVP